MQLSVELDPDVRADGDAARWASGAPIRRGPGVRGHRLPNRPLRLQRRRTVLVASTDGAGHTAPGTTASSSRLVPREKPSLNSGTAPSRAPSAFAEPLPCRLWNIGRRSTGPRSRLGSASRGERGARAGRLDEGLEDATLLVSELVTNAVRHAPREGLPKIELRLKVDPARVRVVVSDPGTGFVAKPRLPTASESSGWGLYLVDRLADRWGIITRDRSEVWFEIDGGCVMSMDPTERRAERRSVRKPRSPGPLAPWIWNPRWIPGFVLGQVAVLLVFAEKSPGSFGVPGGFGALLSVATAIVSGRVGGSSISSAASCSCHSSRIWSRDPSSPSSSAHRVGPARA